jgi:hypothetical protein
MIGLVGKQDGSAPSAPPSGNGPPQAALPADLQRQGERL